MLQRLGIRGKILAVVAVPILVLLIGASALVVTAVREYQRSSNIEQLLNTLGVAREVVDNVQAERLASATYADTYFDARNRRATQRTNVDALFAALQQAALDAPPASRAAAQAAVTAVGAVFEGGDGRRSLADLRALDVTEVGPSRQAIVDGIASGELRYNTVPFPTWPAPSAVDAMSAEYDEITAAIDAIIEVTPESSGVLVALRELSFQVDREGTVSTEFLTTARELEANLPLVYAAVDASVASFRSMMSQLPDSAANAGLLASAAAAEPRFQQLNETRINTIMRFGSTRNIVGDYNDLADILVLAPNEVAASISERQLAATLSGYAAVDVLVENMFVERVVLAQLIRAGSYQPGDADYVKALATETDLSLAAAQRVVNPLPELGDVPNFGASFDTNSQTDFKSVRSNVASNIATTLQGERSSDWGAQVTEEVAVLAPIRDELLRNSTTQAEAATRASLLQAAFTALGALLVLTLSLVVAAAIARRIIGPLRRLTTTATAVRQELPRLVERVALPGERVDVSEVQIPVESSDEVGRLAEAFNSVNAATLAIAGEQAALRGSISEMFVNVARRDQVLLNRQLASIDEMERTEEDSETLTRLFALDHLATRMRRNSESLLVLAGIDTGRRLRRPMPLSDVIRTASSEIELYERIQLELDADPAMLGHSALTAAHLFAELLENATVFSDPGSPVIVRTFERGGNFIVEVADKGIGMTPDELQEANSRVASTAASEILGAQRLGLFVVGRIARRIGARVEITSTEGENTLATVTMPPSLFDARATVEPSITGEGATDAAMHAPAALVRHNQDDEILDVDDLSNVRPPSARFGAGYEPTVATGDLSMQDLIDADAASAPEGIPTRPADLTDGETGSGLPARRRKAAGGEAPRDTKSIIGLPQRASKDQLDALSAGNEAGFVPPVAANEVSPQTVEERASMFRGFRARTAASAEPPVVVPPDAESLGQASRRGAIAPDAIPGLDDEDDRPAIADALAPSADDEAPESSRSRQDPRIVSGYDHEDHESYPPSFEMPSLDVAGVERPALVTGDDLHFDVPMLDVTEDVAEIPAMDRGLDVRSAGVDRVSLNEPTPAAAPEAEPAAAVAPPAPPVQAPVAPIPVAPPAPMQSMDSMLGLSPSSAKPAKKGGLFGRKKKEAAPSLPPVMRTPIIPPGPPVASGAFQPDDANNSSVDFSSDATHMRPPASSLTPTGSAAPYNPGILGGEPPLYSPDQLARPLGWETAGASALQAAEPDAASSYMPVDIQQAEPIAVEDESHDIASAVFSELSSLSASRPKIERTRAGLTKRAKQAIAAPAPEPEVIVVPTVRDADAVRARMTSFYSGTQRARQDAEDFERQTQAAEVTE